MVIKVRLIKPKRKYSHSFYKTQQIKFQSLSIPPLSHTRLHSTEKVIVYRNPWQQLNPKQVNMLAQRLQDKPQQLYEIVKQKKTLEKQKIKLKFNRLTQQDINLQSIKSFTSLSKNFANNFKNNRFSSTNSLRKLFLKQYSLNKGNNLILQPKQTQNLLLRKIKQRRMQYEKELRSIFRDKKLILQTDLPKVNKIRSPSTSLANTIKLKQQKGVRPLLRMR